MANPLNSINTLELMSKIEAWRDVDLRVISDNELTLKLLETITTLSVASRSLSSQKLYRVRPLEEGQKFTTMKDVLYPPADIIKARGRANDIKESMFYCALDKVTPIYECSIKTGDWFALMQYSIKDDRSINVTSVINDNVPPKLNDNGLINFKTTNQFIYNEFTKHVGVGTEYLYKISHKICRDFMDIPFCDGFLYPSIASFKKGYNIALKPESVDNNISFDCMLICKLEEFDKSTNSYKFYLKHKAKEGESGNLKYEF